MAKSVSKERRKYGNLQRQGYIKERKKYVENEENVCALGQFGGRAFDELELELVLNLN